jgi:hypothetical protein
MYKVLNFMVENHVSCSLQGGKSGVITIKRMKEEKEIFMLGCGVVFTATMVKSITFEKDYRAIIELTH